MRTYLLSLLLVLAGCARGDELTTMLSQPVDSSLQAAARRAALHTGRVKFKGPVTIQVGGSGNVASATAAPKAKAPVAVASVARPSSPAPWWPYLLGAGLLFAGGFLVRGRLKIPRPF